MSDVFAQPEDAATPLTAEDRRGLRLSYIATRDELNAAEQENIARGQDWALRRKRNIAEEKFVKELHRHMLGDVWIWAGVYRKIEVNIGVDPRQIPEGIRFLLDDVNYWLTQKTYPSDEIAVRFHHRLTQIHPFPNGNGRHARLMADLSIMRLGEKRFSWGGGQVRETGALRKLYIDALHAADGHDIGPLLAFARS